MTISAACISSFPKKKPGVCGSKARKMAKQEQEALGGGSPSPGPRLTKGSGAFCQHPDPTAGFQLHQRQAGVQPVSLRPHSVRARSLFLPTLWLSLAPRSQAPGISGGKSRQNPRENCHGTQPVFAHISRSPHHPFGCLRTFECAVSDTLNVSASPPLCLLLPIHTVHTWG